MQDINFSEIINFDEEEITSKLSIEQIKKLQCMIKEPKFIDSILEVAYIFDKWNDCCIPDFSENMEGKSVCKMVPDYKLLLTKFSILVQQTLNSLEFFAMSFIHNTADETVIYQSLHSCYIRAIETLYYDISFGNKPGKDRLYTNISELYVKWKRRADEYKEKELAATREQVSRGNKLSY